VPGNHHYSGRRIITFSACVSTSALATSARRRFCYVVFVEACDSREAAISERAERFFVPCRRRRVKGQRRAGRSKVAARVPLNRELSMIVRHPPGIWIRFHRPSDESSELGQGSLYRSHKARTRLGTRTSVTRWSVLEATPRPSFSIMNSKAISRKTGSAIKCRYLPSISRKSR